MRLFLKLFDDNLINHFSTQFEPLLRRFCIMEGVAAIKFVHNKPINDPERTAIVLSNLKSKCIERGFDETKVLFFQQCFRENIIISMLIQEAFIDNCQTLSKIEANQYAINSIAKVTSKETNKDNLLETVRLYIDSLTDEIIFTLNSYSDITNYSLLENLLIHCFNNIDREKLRVSIESLKQSTVFYNSTLNPRALTSVLTSLHPAACPWSSESLPALEPLKNSPDIVLGAAIKANPNVFIFDESRSASPTFFARTKIELANLDYTHSSTNELLDSNSALS